MNPTPFQQAASAAATPKTTTIERIARALAVEAGCDPDAPAWVRYPGAEPCGVCWRDRFVGPAKAALQALRQVDEGTVEAMAKRQFRSVYGSEWSWEFAPESTQHEYLREAEADFTAAIDHILEQDHD